MKNEWSWVDEKGRQWAVPKGKLKYRTAGHAALRAFVHKRDKFTCQNCGIFCENPPQPYYGLQSVHGNGGLLVIDHIVPLSMGGTSHPNNLQTLCDPCNASKVGIDAAVRRAKARVEA